MAASSPDDPSIPRKPGRSRRAALTALPTPLTPFIDREREAADLIDLIRRDDVRLVTLTGPGGVGKTRLAIHVADRIARAYPDGVWFVSLAAIADPAIVAPTIARALGIRETGKRSILAGLGRFLRDRRILVALDNVEGVAAAAPQLGFLLAMCPSLDVIATSRAPLGLSGERAFDVAPFAVPEPGRDLGLPALGELASVRLFAERAQAARASFNLTDANAADVAAICRRLDGLPLAIELAAAWVGVLPPAAIRARLERRELTLTGGPVDQPKRLQTMRDAVAWSYDLLAAGHQALFRRLGVFASGFDLDAVEQVALDDTPAALPPTASDHARPLAALDGVAGLVTRSLVRPQELGADESGAGAPRFHMLETIRDFARERLEASDEFETIARRHAEWCARLVAGARSTIGGKEQEASLRRIEREHDNLRAALRWALDRRDPIAARLAADLWRFWYARSYFSEGRQWLDEALEQSGDLPAALRAPLLLGAGAIAHALGDLSRAEPALESSLALYRAADDPAGAATCLNFLGLTARDHGDLDRAAALHREALALSRTAEDAWRVAFSLNLLGPALERQGDRVAAASLLAESLALASARSDRWSAAAALTNLGHLARHGGDLAQAASLYERALVVYEELGNRQGEAHLLADLALTAARAGDPAAAADRYERSLRLARDLGDARGEAAALIGLGQALLLAGQHEPARARIAEGLALAIDLGDREQIVTGLERMAEEEAANGQSDHAARLAGAAAHLRRSAAPAPPADLALHRQALGAIWTGRNAPPLRDAWLAGERLTMEEAAAAALAPALPTVRGEPVAELAAPRSPAAPSGLTPRELDVLRLLVEGRTDRDIADALFIGRRTVASHVANILGKLAVETRTAAAAYAIRHGLV